MGHFMPYIGWLIYCSLLPLPIYVPVCHWEHLLQRGSRLVKGSNGRRDESIYCDLFCTDCRMMDEERGQHPSSHDKDKGIQEVHKSQHEKSSPEKRPQRSPSRSSTTATTTCYLTLDLINKLLKGERLDAAKALKVSLPGHNEKIRYIENLDKVSSSRMCTLSNRAIRFVGFRCICGSLASEFGAARSTTSWHF